jgi:hypothetical protein
MKTPVLLLVLAFFVCLGGAAAAEASSNNSSGSALFFLLCLLFVSRFVSLESLILRCLAVLHGWRWLQVVWVDLPCAHPCICSRGTGENWSYSIFDTSGSSPAAKLYCERVQVRCRFKLHLLVSLWNCLVCCPAAFYACLQSLIRPIARAKHDGSELNSTWLHVTGIPYAWLIDEESNTMWYVLCLVLPWSR